jgi:two-component system chemotaxis response regulator CheB
MDLEMPVMGGMEAIEAIMCSKAVPILVVSGVADAHKAFQAVSLGAIDVVGKPNMTSRREVEELIDKARLVSKIPVITMPKARQSAPTKSVVSPSFKETPDQGRIIAIASSTGGPQALAVILARLPADLSCPVIIAQHIADGFAAGMAEWLNTLSPLPVRLASDGDRLEPGRVYLSPSESNVSVGADRHIRLLPHKAGQIYRPSCDVLLSSVSEAAGRSAIGVILTGMGSDGVKGMEAVKAGGGLTLAQDEASSVIFGMNAIAIEKGWAEKVMSPEELAAALAGLGAPSPGGGR